MNLILVSTMLAAFTLQALVPLLIAVLVGVIIFYVVKMFITDPKIVAIIGLIIGLIILIYALQILGVMA